MSKAEFEALFETHAVAVLSYLQRRVDRASAEDALSETFLVAWRRRAEIPERQLPWLYGVARHILANQARGDARRRELSARVAREPVASPSPDDGLSEPTLRALRSLSSSDREVLLLDAWEELTPQEAASVLGCRPSTYSVRLHRATKRFKAALSAEDAPPAFSRRPSESPS